VPSNPSTRGDRGYRSASLLALGARGFLIATSIAEEQENLMSFGAAYAV
jgi:hypothetical protein